MTCVFIRLLTITRFLSGKLFKFVFQIYYTCIYNAYVCDRDRLFLFYQQIVRITHLVDIAETFRINWIANKAIRFYRKVVRSATYSFNTQVWQPGRLNRERRLVVRWAYNKIIIVIQILKHNWFKIRYIDLFFIIEFLFCLSHVDLSV